MKRLATYGLAAALIALSGCAESTGVVDPTVDRRKWNWDSPLATIGGSPVLVCAPLSLDFNIGTVTCSFANGSLLNFPTWRFEADDGTVKSGPIGAANWSGKMIVSGYVVVSYADGRVPSHDDNVLTQLLRDSPDRKSVV